MKNITLVKIGAIGGVLTCSMGLALKYKINNNIKATTFYKESMNLVRHNRAAVYFLGEPIKDCTIDTLNSNQNYIKDNIGKYEVRLKGSKQNGRLHIFIQKDENGEDKWVLDSLELAIDDQPDKRLLIKKETFTENHSSDSQDTQF